MSKPDDLIESLVRDLKPMPAHALERRMAALVLPALGLSLLVMLVFFGFRVDMAHALSLPVFWIKSAYNALLAILAFVAIRRLSRPDGDAGGIFAGFGLVVAAMAIVAGIQLAVSPTESYRVLIMGRSALHCPFLILGFALPVLYANFSLLRKSAPVDLRLAGFVAGLAAGAAGAWVYSWFCTENGMPFVLLWYSLGILLVGLIGALAGPRLLRW